MKKVQSRLGHTNVRTTMNVYIHVTNDAKEETASLFANFTENKDKKNLGQPLGQKKYPLD